MRKIAAFAVALLMFCSYAQARKVSGKVVSGEESLSGVIVTDGTNFTTTKNSGKFSFEIKDDAEFVYIVIFLNRLGRNELHLVEDVNNKLQL